MRQPDGALGAGLGPFQSAHRAGTGHRDGALTDAFPGQRQGLAGSQSGVGEHGNKRRTAQQALGEEVPPELLDLSRSDWPDDDPPASTRLVCHAHRVLGDTFPLHCPLEDALKHASDLLHAGGREAVPLELSQLAVEYGGT